MALRSDENEAASALEKYVRDVLQVSVSWAEGLNPPDCEFSIGNIQFLVEITTIVLQYPQSERKKPLSFIGWRKQLDGFANQITNEAQKAGYLSGYYILQMAAPRVSETLTPGDYNVIKAEALDFVRNTASFQSHEPETLATQFRRRISIEKLAIAKDKVDGIPVGMSRWEGEAFDELFELLTLVIKDKTNKMAHLSGSKILLVIDRYNFATFEHYRRAISNCETNPFCSILLIRDGIATPVWGELDASSRSSA